MNDQTGSSVPWLSGPAFIDLSKTFVAPELFSVPTIIFSYIYAPQ